MLGVRAVFVLAGVLVPGVCSALVLESSLARASSLVSFLL